MANKVREKYNRLEKIVTIAGILVIFLGIITACFSLWVNRSSIYDLFDIAYYLRYPLLLCGGYFIGYIMQPKKPRERFLFDGASYSLLSIITFFLLDYMRTPLHNIVGIFPYPWERIVFEGMPLLALFAVLTLGIVLKGYSRSSEALFRRLFVVLFVILQIEMTIYPILISALPALSFDLMITYTLYMLFTPLFIAILAFALLGNIKAVLSRAFFAAVIGTIYFVTYLLLFEFSTNPMAEAVEVFRYFSLILTLISTAVLIRLARKSLRSL